MPKYLFTSDQRISVLPQRIKWVAEFIHSGHNISEIADKSDNNNATTLKFYYNLHNGTETCNQAVDNPIFAIRNFALKFQFPNTRTQESLQNTITERILLAPFRSVVSLLEALSVLDETSESALSMTEVLYFIFCNPRVYYNPAVNYNLIAAQIVASRKKGIDYEEAVPKLLEWNQYGRQVRELIYVLSYASNCFSFSKGVLKYSKSHEDYNKDEEFIKELLTYNKFWYPSNVQDFNLSNLEYISYMNTANTPFSIIEFTPHSVDAPNEVKFRSLQQIFYGAPGTGKSHEIKEKTKGKSVIRTTFHPDSDYSTFVGCYKPTMVEDDVKVVPVVINNGISLDQNKGSYKENRISYKFVMQAFLKAYLGAWKKYVDYSEETIAPQFLVIEEINRGNCAQIFGDLFQLLDRSDNNFSEYPIEADTDLQKEIERAFREDINYKLEKDIDVEGVVEDYISNYNATLSEDIQHGRVLLLPSNLYIWATMNTSDQSLFPIDSAFKRRWDWVYIPIKQHDEEYKIKIDKAVYDWWGFLEKINQVIGDTTSSEDKKLGYFFVKAEDKEIGADKFVSKVLFYLWNDVFKNYGFDNPIFSRGENKKFVFSDFFLSDGSPDTNMVNQFLIKIDDTVNKENSFVESAKTKAESTDDGEMFQ